MIDSLTMIPDFLFISFDQKLASCSPDQEMKIPIVPTVLIKSSHWGECLYFNPIISDKIHQRY